jgi:thiamine biosynthesis lipoprotein
MGSRMIRIPWCIGLVFLVSCEELTDKRIDSFASMGTVVHVQDGTNIEIVKEIFEHIDSELSEWRPNSSLSEINMNAGKSGVNCSETVVSAIRKALYIAHLTDGAFDPTWACMWHLWDFELKRAPSIKEVVSLLPLVQWKKVSVTNTTIFLEDEGMLLGLGAMAKGIALNQTRDALLANGVEDFLLRVGGQVLVQGSERTIGIRNPEGLAYDIIGVVTLQNRCISTSGDYEKYFFIDGVRFHHIIDPATGFPTTGLKSVSVIAEDAAIADALSTALMVMGVHAGLALIEELDGIEVLFIDDLMALHQSTGFHLDSHPSGSWQNK